MGTSFVTLGRTAGGTAAEQGNQVGFWINDADLELLLRILALHIPDPASTRGAGEARSAFLIRDQWLLASRGWFLGCVPHGLEEAANTEAGMAIVRSAVAALLAALRHVPESLPGGVGVLLGIEGVFAGQIPTWRLRACAEALGDLLDGRIVTTSRDGTVIPGAAPVG